MTNMRLLYIALATFVVGSSYYTNAFVDSLPRSVRPVVFAASLPPYQPSSSSSPIPSLFASPTDTSSESQPPLSSTAITEFPPILDELRTVAMKLHTREQAPREGRAEAATATPSPYNIPTHANYLQFLVDSHAIYTALEDIVNKNEKLRNFRHTGIERTISLTKDIAWMCTKFNLPRPDVGQAGATYVKELKAMMMMSSSSTTTTTTTTDNNDENDNNIPKFMCHYYNYYFAHLAGGRMIGKQMSKLLLDGETLEFYKVSVTLSLLTIHFTERSTSRYHHRICCVDEKNSDLYIIYSLFFFICIHITTL